MKHSSVLPRAFTEHGVMMLASVLNSQRAVKMSIYIVNTFIKLREMLSTNKEILLQLIKIEKRIEGHDENIGILFNSLRSLISAPKKKTKRIGFVD
jgi:hypothetical protein